MELFALIFIWTILPTYHLETFLVGAILTLYFIIVTHLEERKIVEIYGTAYRRYKDSVSMLFPWKWCRKRNGFLSSHKNSEER